jgi:hypothetical protein
LIGGWVAIRTILDTVEKKEINIFPLPWIESRTSSP